MQVPDPSNVYTKYEHCHLAVSDDTGKINIYRQSKRLYKGFTSWPFDMGV